MFLRILKKDLKRKKTMNFILLLFIILATMFVSSGINNVITVMDGTDYYLDMAGVGDYNIITSGENSVGSISKVIDNVEDIKECNIENVVFGFQGNVFSKGRKELKIKNSMIFQSLDDLKISLFDIDNEKIKSVKEGNVYVSGDFMETNNLKDGDTIYVEHSGVKIPFIIEGKVKDAFLGGKFLAIPRFILNGKDMQKLLENETINSKFRGEIAYIKADDIDSIASIVSDIPSVVFDGSRETTRMSYIMDMIVAFIILILSICLIMVSFVVLKFSINFTIAEEFREIGVMKAIGIGERKIRSIYIIKYLTLAVVGATIGFLASIPFGDMLLKSVSENMVLGNNIGVVSNLLGALTVVSVIILFAYYFTGKVKKSSPVDAIRLGKTGERYKKKSIYRIGKSHAGTSFYMAVNDILSSPRRYFTIMISFFICTLFVLILVNTTDTMKSSSLIDTFTTRSDLYMTDNEGANKCMSKPDKSGIEEYLDKKEKDLIKQGMPAELSVEVQYKYKISVDRSFNKDDYLITCMQGVGTKAAEYKYLEGIAPQNEKEIAITPQISEKIGVKIGDLVTIDFGDKKLDCMVTGYFQTLDQLGEMIRFNEKAPTKMKYASGVMDYQINFTDNPTIEEIEIRKEKIKELYKIDEVMNATEYCIDFIGVTDTMEVVKYMLLVITLIVVLLVTILMERSFIEDEKSQIAILKAIGFKDRDIIKWHTLRFSLIALIAVVFAGVLSIPMTDICISPIFKMMGSTDINYKIDPLQIFVIYPGVIFVATIIIAWTTSLYTKKIKSSETSNIE